MKTYLKIKIKNEYFYLKHLSQHLKIVLLTYQNNNIMLQILVLQSKGSLTYLNIL